MDSKQGLLRRKGLAPKNGRLGTSVVEHPHSQLSHGCRKFPVSQSSPCVIGVFRPQKTKLLAVDWRAVDVSQPVSLYERNPEESGLQTTNLIS
jgi:hypothetical protein